MIKRGGSKEGPERNIDVQHALGIPVNKNVAKFFHELRLFIGH
jgi:hypothetical protein